MKVFYWLLGILIVFFLLLPLCLGDSSYLIIIDNLDSEFIYLHLLKSAGLLFSNSSNAPVESVMNGLPRSYFHSEYNIVRVFFLCLPSLYAYILNGAVVRIIGYCGSFLLVRDHFLKERKNYASYIAFIFACMPLYTIYGMSVSGLPFLFWAFLELKEKSKKALPWVVIVLYPFYSHFALVGVFAIIFIGLYGAYVLFLEKRFETSYWIGIIMLCLFFMISDISLIKDFLFSATVSHRTGWNLPFHGLGEVMSEALKIFIRGHYHAGTFFALPIYILIFFVMYSNYRRNQKDKRLYVIVLSLALISLIYPAYGYFRTQLKDSLPILMSFQFNRFIFLIPLLWMIGLAIALDQCQWKEKYVGLLLIVQLGLTCWSNNELKLNTVHSIGISTTGFYFDQPNFKQFFSPSMLSEINTYINQPQSSYRVVSVGIYPSVAQYGGFYTLDSYQNNYPLDYKNEFRKIISGELGKDPSLKLFFDDWGSRCYVFSADLWKKYKVSFEKLKKDEDPIGLSLDTNQIERMGGKYIFSGVPIRDFQSLGLIFERKFSRPDSNFDIYLYRIL